MHYPNLVVCIIAPLHFFILSINATEHNATHCTSNIYCHGPILDAVQRSGLFADSKTFVDMPGVKSEAGILDGFRRTVPSGNKLADIKRFVSEHFGPAGSDLVSVEPEDYTEVLPFKVSDDKLQAFAEMIHGKWKHLMRRYSPSNCPDCPQSSIPLPHPFVVPGGRFREFYYWDSYWILEGLLASRMCVCAKHLVANMLWMVGEYGLVPNGARSYYLGRSQPPLLLDMVTLYADKCILDEQEKGAFFIKAIPLLDREYKFWMERRSITVNGYQLNIYSADQASPRPESYREDVLLARSLPNKKLSSFFKSISAAAESGWDFSGRWLDDPDSLTSIRTTTIIPVDLNSILYHNEMLLSQMIKRWLPDLPENLKKAKDFEQSARKRKHAMWALMHDVDGWGDYDIKSRQVRHDRPYLSNLSPHWFGLDDATAILQSAHVQQMLFGYPGGAVTSLLNTGQQWDYPNVWAPLQHRLIHWLETCGEHELALELAQKFINSAYCGWQKYDGLFEKYHGVLVGEPGGGGEYVVQEGFGWTNGVLLLLLSKYGEGLKAPDHCARYEMSVFGDIEIFWEKLVAGALLIASGVSILLVIVTTLMARQRRYTQIPRGIK